jgi:hypothetical protein
VPEERRSKPFERVSSAVEEEAHSPNQEGEDPTLRQASLDLISQQASLGPIQHQASSDPRGPRSCHRRRRGGLQNCPAQPAATVVHTSPRASQHPPTQSFTPSPSPPSTWAVPPSSSQTRQCKKHPTPIQRPQSLKMQFDETLPGTRWNISRPTVSAGSPQQQSLTVDLHFVNHSLRGKPSQKVLAFVPPPSCDSSPARVSQLHGWDLLLDNTPPGHRSPLEQDDRSLTEPHLLVDEDERRTSVHFVSPSLSLSF